MPPHDHDAAHAPAVTIVDLSDADERTRIESLVAACERADGHPPFGDHELLAIQTGTIEDHVGFGIARRGELAGYGHLSRLGDAWFCEVAVHPAHRGHGLATMLMDAVVAHAGVHGGGSLSTWTYRHAADVDGLARHVGFHPQRTLFQMRLPGLPAEAPPLPEGIVLDAFRPGRDEAEWLRLNARAFAALPDQGAWTERDLRARLRASWFDAQDFLVARRDGAMAGACWTKLDARARTAGGEQIGEIYVIAVDPAEAGHGLGRTLTLAGLAHLRARGARVGMLYVDARNDAALRMYEAMGFGVHHEDVCLVTQIPAAG